MPCTYVGQSCRCRAASGVLAAAIAGCGGGSNTSSDAVASILMDPPAATISVRQTVQITATPLNAAGDPLEARAIAWRQIGDAAAVAGGNVIGLTAGTDTVTATSEGKVGRAVITVTPADVAGTWYLTEETTDETLQITCHDTATVTLTQTGETFTGTTEQSGTCDTSSGPVDHSGAFQLTDGSAVGTDIAFTEPGDPTCAYTGTVTDFPASNAGGNLTCSGGGFSFTGDWSLSRSLPSASIAHARAGRAH